MGQLQDRQDIIELVHRLGVCLDEGSFDDMRSLLVEDATVKTPGGAAAGREALIAQARRNHGPDHRIQHVITDVLVDLDTDRANVRANLVVHFAPIAPIAPTAASAPPAVAPQVGYTLGEVYRFGAVRTDQGWRLERVETTPVWRQGEVPIPAAPAGR